MGFAVDRIGDCLYGSVAHRHLEYAGVGAAETHAAVVAARVLNGLIVGVGVGPAVRVIVVALIPALIVPRQPPRFIVVGRDIALADEVGFARAIADLARGDHAAAIAEAVGIRRHPGFGQPLRCRHRVAIGQRRWTPGRTTYALVRSRRDRSAPG